jgi:DNA-binding GntR family transcriptional regulator
LNKDSKPIIDLSNINEKVYGFIKKRIIHLTYPPGHKINVRQLQRELGISQTPIKDALFRLAGEGIIEISSRRGTFVKGVTEKDIEELFATRFILEAGAVDLVAIRLTNEQLEELEEIYNETLKSGLESNYELFMEKDRAFHAKIIEFTGNLRLMETYSHLSSHMQIVRFRAARHNVGKMPWVNEDHLNILKALQDRNPEKAREVIRNHFSKSMHFLSRQVGELHPAPAPLSSADATES